MRRPYPGGASQDGFSGIYSWSGEEQCEGEISLFLCDFHWVRAWRGVGRCCEHWQLLSKDGRLGDGEKSVGRRARIVEELATWAWTGPLAPACAGESAASAAAGLSPTATSWAREKARESDESAHLQRKIAVIVTRTGRPRRRLIKLHSESDAPPTDRALTSCSRSSIRPAQELWTSSCGNQEHRHCRDKQNCWQRSDGMGSSDIRRPPGTPVHGW